MENITDILVTCPNCKDLVFIEKLNCCIFRHGVLQSNGKQIEPHASKELCDYYFTHNLIYGCGKPFKVIWQDCKFVAIDCDYI